MAGSEAAVPVNVETFLSVPRPKTECTRVFIPLTTIETPNYVQVYIKGNTRKELLGSSGPQDTAR